VNRLKIELKSSDDRRKAFFAVRERILSDLVSGRIPTFHVLHFEKDGSADNHYMTPISVEPVNDQGCKMIWIQDFEFWLKLLLKIKRVVNVEYDPSRPAVIFTYDES